MKELYGQTVGQYIWRHDAKSWHKKIKGQIKERDLQAAHVQRNS